MSLKRYIVAANWKLYGTRAQATALVRTVKRSIRQPLRHVGVVIAPPFTALDAVRRLTDGSEFELAAQNVFWEEQGAFTGEVSPAMLLDAGCRRVLVGHSERRRRFGETDRDVHRKLAACAKTELSPILCIGETLGERRARRTRRVLSRQLTTALKGNGKNGKNLLAVAYEPVWAIGTGRKATSEQIHEAHGWIRRVLGRTLGGAAGAELRILYGGSVNAENAAELARIPGVDGVLVGSASLDARSFVSIIRTFETAEGERNSGA